MITSGGSTYSPHGIAVDSSGNVYVGDIGTNLDVEIWTPSGGSYTNKLVTSSATGASNWPQGVEVDSQDNICVTDQTNHRILEETPSGGSFVQAQR